MSRREGELQICSSGSCTLAEIGELERARTLCEKLLPAPRCCCTPRRSIRTAAGTMGSFPQAFTHLALINAVMHIIDADQVLNERAPVERTSRPGRQAPR